MNRERSREESLPSSERMDKEEVVGVYVRLCLSLERGQSYRGSLKEEVGG